MKKIFEKAFLLVLFLITGAAVLTFLAPYFGWRVDSVCSGSMEPELKVGGIVVTRPVSTDKIEIGDIITFSSPGNGQATSHRVISITTDSPPGFKTKGDANEDNDPFVVPAVNVIGEICFHVPYFGYTTQFIKTPLGLLLTICVPGLLIIILEIRNIWTLCTKKRCRNSNRLDTSWGNKWLSVLIGTLILVQMVYSTGVTSSSFIDTADSSVNSFSAWTSTLWQQTTQDDFEAGILDDTDTGSSPGDVRLLAANWYDGNWAYRKKITIDHTKVAGDLTQFPVLISLQSDADLAAHTQFDGDDIVFTSADGTTKLAHEIETYDGNMGKLIAWVRITSLSSSADTDIFMYYGNAVCTSQHNCFGVWDNDFKMVQHLNDTSGTSGIYYYYNDFESGVGFDYGNLNPRQIPEAKKTGDYGIRGDGGKNYMRACVQEYSGRDVIFQSWVCPRESNVTSLAAICFGQQTTGEAHGYQCLIDQRSGGLMQIRKDYDSSAPLAQSSVPTILDDTWYWFRVIWETSGQITFELYDTNKILIDSISAIDTTYIDGYYGVAAYQNADWDDYSVQSIDTRSMTDDSTIYGNDGIKTGENNPYETPGIINNGQAMDGSDDQINCGDDDSLAVDYITVESWVKFDVNTGKRVIASIDDNTNRRWGLYLLDGSPSVLRFFVFSNGSWVSPDYVWRPETDTWYYIVGVKDETHVRTYINGVEVGTPQPQSGVIDKDPMDLRIGVGNYPGYLDGTMDEVRISGTARSAAWISTCYNNQSSPETFYLVENETEMFSPSGTVASQVLDTGSNGTIWDSIHWDETVTPLTNIMFEVRASDTQFLQDDTELEWISIGGTSPVSSSLPSGRYMQWRAILVTTVIPSSPTLQEVRLYFH